MANTRLLPNVSEQERWIGLVESYQNALGFKGNGSILAKLWSIYYHHGFQFFSLVARTWFLEKLKRVFHLFLLVFFRGGRARANGVPRCTPAEIRPETLLPPVAFPYLGTKATLCVILARHCSFYVP